MSETCGWLYENNQNDITAIYVTECGSLPIAADFQIKDFTYCPTCGKPIEEVINGE